MSISQLNMSSLKKTYIPPLDTLIDKFVLHSKEKCKNIVETIVICYKQRRENSLACNFLTLVANKSRYLSQALSQLSVRVI